jgi:hypothetical protein
MKITYQIGRGDTLEGNMRMIASRMLTVSALLLCAGVALA